MQVHKPMPVEIDWQCAICLNEIPLSELATIKGCEHAYCGAHLIPTTVLSYDLRACRLRTSGTWEHQVQVMSSRLLQMSFAKLVNKFQI
jgi:hypothetical protein